MDDTEGLGIGSANRPTPLNSSRGIRSGERPWRTLIRAREALLETLEATKGAPQRRAAEADVQATWTRYKLVADQV